MRKVFYFLILILLIGPSLYKTPTSAQVSPTKTTSRNQLELLEKSKEATKDSTVSSQLLNENLTLFNRRITTAVGRIDKIATRISSRMEKMKEEGLITKKHNTSYTNIISRIQLLKTEWENAEDLSSKITNTNVAVNYQPYRKQVLVVLGRLEEVLEAEKTLVADLIKLNK